LLRVSTKTRSPPPSSPEPLVINIDAINTVTKSDNEEDLDAELCKTSTDTTISLRRACCSFHKQWSWWLKTSTKAWCSGPRWVQPIIFGQLGRLSHSSWDSVSDEFRAKCILSWRVIAMASCMRSMGNSHG
jgi:hypothetical protein